MPTSLHAGVEICYQPILDVARGVTAGYDAQPCPATAGRPERRRAPAASPELDARTSLALVSAALADARRLPAGAFLSVPVGVRAAATGAVRTALGAHGSLAGIALDLVGPIGPVPDRALEAAVGEFRSAGALISVGGHSAPPPELTSIVRLRPAVLRLGEDWVRGIDASRSKHSTVELIERLADHVDALILAEGVTTAAELRALAELQVPLAQGPFVGAAQPPWPQIADAVASSLRYRPEAADGVLRGLLQDAPTSSEADARPSSEADAPSPAVATGTDVAVVVDAAQRPTALLERSGTEAWRRCAVLPVGIDTPVVDAVHRAMTRPRAIRFTPLVCVDDSGRFVGILAIDRLMSHLAGGG
jgi:hypothetical protein